MNEDDTTSSSRIFIKILFQEITEGMGLKTLTAQFKDPMLSHYLSEIFPTDNPKNTRFSINFFTSIGLGAVTEDMREHLKRAPAIAVSLNVVLCWTRLLISSADGPTSSNRGRLVRLRLFLLRIIPLLFLLLLLRSLPFPLSIKITIKVAHAAFSIPISLEVPRRLSQSPSSTRIPTIPLPPRTTKRYSSPRPSVPDWGAQAGSG
jgi:hypothetical protein